MTEEIKTQPTAGEQNVAVPSSPQGRTGGARCGAERNDGKPTVSWAALLDEAVSKPGYIHQAYSRFHNYSLGNQLLALFQCVERQIQPGPLASFLKWKELGRHVKKGEKAITLCMPFTCKRTRTVKKDDGSEQDEQFTFTHFTYKNNWFVLTQTEGKEYQAPTIPEWNEQQALEGLEIERIPFEGLDGNTQGYARRGGKIAINPLAALPHKTFFHEAAHCLLHCQETDLTDTDQTPRNVAEVEAEAVALLCCESLGLPGAFTGSYSVDIHQRNHVRVSIAHRELRYSVPNELIQEEAGQRQDAAGEEDSGQADYDLILSPNLLFSAEGNVRDEAFRLWSNDLSAPVIVAQQRGFREGYARMTLTGQHHKDNWKIGTDAIFDPVHEALQYRITNPSLFDPDTTLKFSFLDRRTDVEPS
ncbi:MAG: ArdC family protein, partial [Terriglobia bacterium]